MGDPMSWPGFTNLFGAWFFLAMIPLVILYFLKLRRPRVELPSLVLWQSVVNDQRVNSPFQRFRRNLLLLLQLLLLASIVLALMQPFLQSGSNAAEYLPVLIDCSASMAAKEGKDGRSRLDLVKELVQQQIDNLRSDQRMALFAFSSTGRRLTEFTDDQRLLTRTLQSLEPTDLPAQLDDVMRMAAAYTRSFEIERVTVMTDGNLPEQVDFELPFSVDVRRVAPGGPNIGITEMSARRSSADEWEVFLRISGSTAELRNGELQLFENGVQTAAQAVEVGSDESQRLVFPVSATDARILEARVVPKDEDSLEIDNSVWLTLPQVRPLKVLVSSELTSWRHALNVLPKVEIEDAADGNSGTGEWDLVVADTEALKSKEAPVRLFIGVLPEDLKGLVTIQEDVTNVVDWNRTAPLLRHVQLSDVQIGEKPTLAENRSAKDLEERGYEVLIDGTTGPLLLQKREGLRISYWFLFHTDRSTLPYRLGFPIIAANAVESALKQASLSEVTAAPTGVLPALSLEADREYQVRSPAGDTVTLRSSGSGALTGAAAARVGKYDILDGNDVVTSIGTGLLNSRETGLAAAPEIRFTEISVSSDADARLETDRPLWWLLALGAFILLLVEWWYFQRGRGVAA